jgi:hypothetical protein
VEVPRHVADADALTPPADEPTDRSISAATALADAGAEVLRALASTDHAMRRKHIGRAMQLLVIASDADSGVS